MPVYVWESDWTDFKEMSVLQETLHNEIESDIESLNHLEYAGMYALNQYAPVYSPKDREQLKSQCYAYSDAMKSTYIKQQIASIYVAP